MEALRVEEKKLNDIEVAGNFTARKVIEVAHKGGPENAILILSDWRKWIEGSVMPGSMPPVDKNSFKALIEINKNVSGDFSVKIERVGKYTVDASSSGTVGVTFKNFVLFSKKIQVSVQ